MKKGKISELSIFDRMVKDDNKGIQMSTTIVKVSDDPRGSIIEFGVEKNIGEDARIQKDFGLPGKYMIFCMAVNRNEYEKTRVELANSPIEFVPQPSEIETYFNEKQNHKRIHDDLGWTGEYSLSAKDILDLIIDLQRRD